MAVSVTVLGSKETTIRLLIQGPNGFRNTGLNCHISNVSSKNLFRDIKMLRIQLFLRFRYYSIKCFLYTSNLPEDESVGFCDNLSLKNLLKKLVLIRQSFFLTSSILS